MSFDTQNQTTQPNGGAPPSGIGAPAPLTPSESLAEFLAFRKQFEQALQPRNVVEQTMAYQLASTAWRLRRLPYLESLLVGVLFQRGTAWKELDLLSRHEARLNRVFAQGLRDFEARHKAPALQPELASPARLDPRAPERKSASAPAMRYQAAPPPPPPDPLSQPFSVPKGASPPA